jgi:hypothetical protein
MRVNPNNLLAVPVGLSLNLGLNATATTKLKNKRLVHGLLMAALFTASSAQAATWSYGFDGDFSTQFSTFVDTGTGANVVQSGGELKFSTPDLAGNGDGADKIYSFSPFAPTFNQSWTAQVTVALPASLDSLSTNDWFISPFIGVFATAGDGTSYVYVNNLETGTDQYPSGRKFNPEYYVDDTEVGDGVGVTSTSLQSATLTLSYDAASRTFTAGNQDGGLRTLDASSFAKMQGSDQMSILIGFSTYADIPGLSIPDATPLALSNFSVTTPVPEPGSYAMLLAGLGLVGFMVKRRKQVEA